MPLPPQGRAEGCAGAHRGGSRAGGGDGHAGAQQQLGAVLHWVLCCAACVPCRSRSCRGCLARGPTLSQCPHARAGAQGLARAAAGRRRQLRQQRQQGGGRASRRRRPRVRVRLRAGLQAAG
jgi:hypothetical protein